MNAIRRFFKNDQAIAVTEYGLLVALIAVALIAVVLLFGRDISTWFTTKTSQTPRSDPAVIADALSSSNCWRQGVCTPPPLVPSLHVQAHAPSRTLLFLR